MLSFYIADCCYMHIKSSSARSGHKAYLISPFMEFTMASCFSFSYIMHGKDIGSLKVYLRDYKGEVLKVLLEKHGNQGPDWVDFKMKVKSYKDFEVRIIHRRDGVWSQYHLLPVSQTFDSSGLFGGHR